jgi:hypothetical protein
LQASTTEEEFGYRFDSYGYSYSSIIANMGSGFVWLVIAVLYQLLLLPIYWILGNIKWYYISSVLTSYSC